MLMGAGSPLLTLPTNPRTPEGRGRCHSDFFSKKCDHPSLFQNPPASQLLASKFPSSIPAFPSHSTSSTDNIDVIDIDMIPDLRPCNCASAPSSHPLVTRLHSISMHLPESVTIGQEDEPFAAFLGNPWGLIGAEDDPSCDPWECMVNPTLNRVIGFGTSTHQIADVIWHGPFGIDGFCQWIEICMVELRIAPELLEMKLQHVFDGLNLLYVLLLTFIIADHFLKCVHLKAMPMMNPNPPWQFLSISALVALLSLVHPVTKLLQHLMLCFPIKIQACHLCMNPAACQLGQTIQINLIYNQYQKSTTAATFGAVVAYSWILVMGALQCFCIHPKSMEPNQYHG